MKKFLLIFLAATIAFSCISVYAENDELNVEDIQLILGQLEIMNGYPDGSFYPDRMVTRAEFAKIAVMASVYRDYVASGMNTSPFADVQYTHWAAPYVKLASVNKFVTGYPDSTFKPENNVLMEEAVTVVVKMLGYNDDDFAASWPYGQIGVAKNTGLLENISASMGDYLTRGDVAQLIYNTLRAKPKSTTQADAEYITSIGYSLKENVTILATSKEDSSIGSGKVATSSGTYKINDYFDYSIVGKKGYALLSDSNELLVFIVNNLTTINYNVYSVLENEIVAYKDGSLVSLKLSDNLTTYYKLQTLTMGTIKNQLDTGYLLLVAYDRSGNPEYVAVNDSELEGPITVLSDSFWDSLGLSSSPVVMRDGNRSSLSNITKYDVVYYSTALDMIWAYSKKITGTYEEAYPSRDSVSSIKISGTTYAIESAEAAAALSSSGDFTLGDTITVLIGKDGEIAGVVSSKNVSNTVYGYVIATGTSEFTDSDGNLISSRYVQLVHTDGTTVKYKTSNNYSSYLHKSVKLTLSNGLAKLNSISSNSNISGEVDYDRMLIGKTELSENVRILEVTSNTSADPVSYTTLFTKRLDGINIKSSQILYYAKDTKGRVTDLILYNVTGDAYKYGLITSATTSTSAGEGGTYIGYMGTEPVTLSSQNKKYSVTTGQPVQFIMNGNSVSGITALTQVTDKIESISAAYLVTEERTYRISDNCVVYNAQNNVMTINDALDDYSLKYIPYIDKYSNTVRVIKALHK